MEENRCVICGKVLHDPLAIYCAECEYELKRARLADEETLEEWLERMQTERMTPMIPEERGKIRSLDEWF